MSIDDSDSTELKIGNSIKESKNNYFIDINKNQRMSQSTGQILYIFSGEVALYCIRNSRLILTIQSPVIFGVDEITNFTKIHYVNFSKPCTSWASDIAEASRFFTDKRLWG